MSFERRHEKEVDGKVLSICLFRRLGIEYNSHETHMF